jgi:hypothetical protein
LKREDLNLTVLAALFQRPEALAGVQAWLTDHPTSKYSRMTGHLAAWLTGHVFEYQLPAGSPRVRLLDPERYVVGPEWTDARFGVVANLLGDQAFSPLIRRTERLDFLLAADLTTQVRTAFNSIEPEMLSRAVDYLYLSRPARPTRSRMRRRTTPGQRSSVACSNLLASPACSTKISYANGRTRSSTGARPSSVIARGRTGCRARDDFATSLTSSRRQPTRRGR